MAVVGGWQTYDYMKDELLGPVFRDIRDLWKWQRTNVFGRGE
jgi:hypothetical protein